MNLKASMTFLRSALQGMDLRLALGAALLGAAGFFAILSASKMETALAISHLRNLLLGFALIALCSKLSCRFWFSWAPLLYGLAVALLLAVDIMGVVSHGAKRWLDFGAIRLQPSEIMKVALPLVLSWHYSGYHGRAGKKHIIALALVVLPAGLVLAQPDLGTAVLLVSTAFWAMFLAGISWRWLLAAMAAAACAMPFLWSMLHDYQKMRFLVLLDPRQDPLGAGYHILQSTIAIGSGGLWGKGWGEGTQTHLDFLPESATDFVFAVIAEEFGLAGVAALFLLFFLVGRRMLSIAGGSPAVFSRLISASLAFEFLFSVLVNIGMVAGVLPVVGVPLPFVSYGGSAIVTTCVGFGIVMATKKKTMIFAKTSP